MLRSAKRNVSGVAGFANRGAGRRGLVSPNLLSLNLHSVLCITVQRAAKSGGNFPQPFVCLAIRTRAIRRKLRVRVSVSDHRQHFGNCFDPAVAVG